MRRSLKLEAIKQEWGRRVKAARGLPVGPKSPCNKTYCQLVLCYLQASAAFDQYDKHRRLPHRWHALRREYRGKTTVATCS